MKTAAVSLVTLLTAANAHYTFPSVNYNGVVSSQWQYVRETANHYSNDPVTDVTSGNMTCYQLAAGSEGASILSVTAGSAVTFTVSPDIYHPGPLSVWLGRVPSGSTAQTWDGSGANWFKIYQDYPTVTSSGLTWANNGYTQFPVTIPSCLANGDYLLRAEHIALHTAETVGGAQFYLSCAQIHVTGGSGTFKTSSPVSIPGVYSATDPGILINIYYPIPTNYTPPGPPPEKC